MFTLKEEQMSNSFKNKNNPFPAAQETEHKNMTLGRDRR